MASTLETEHFGTGELVALAWAFARTRPWDRDVQVGRKLWFVVMFLLLVLTSVLAVVVVSFGCGCCGCYGGSGCFFVVVSFIFIVWMTALGAPHATLCVISSCFFFSSPLFAAGVFERCRCRLQKHVQRDQSP